MFQPQIRHSSRVRSAYELLERIFHASVRDIRKSSGNAVLGLIMAIVQSIVMVLIFYVIFVVFGLRGNAIRGDFLLYVMSGVFMFMTHTKAIGAVAGADGPTSSMMMHAPMNPIVSIAAAALSSLYIQTLSASVILLFYHTVFSPITIDQPVPMMGMFLLSWISGVAIGMVFLSAKPWQPETVGLIRVIYQRANMIASGKMLVANATPANIRSLFDWNPLFHTIDQGRGFIFLNYNPRYTSIEYPIYIALICIMIGLMGEFYTRQYASASWGKRR
ncbi:MAG: ABC transporter permease [Tabrizicola sp.]|nr:ABC transporter permease [Tabrizicola sp.]